jgi:hypothetical protein
VGAAKVEPPTGAGLVEDELLEGVELVVDELLLGVVVVPHLESPSMSSSLISVAARTETIFLAAACCCASNEARACRAVT